MLEVVMNYNQEQWKSIEDFCGEYQVSTFGNVKSVERYVWNGKGYVHKRELILKQTINHKGYPIVYLSHHNKKKTVPIHRLVAIAFIPNPLAKPQVNHINGNKSDNRVENLEWCTNGENQKHAWRTGLQKVSHKAGKPIRGVLQIDISTGKVVNEYNSISEAAKAVGCKTASNIGGCCRQSYGRKTIKGYLWKFKDEGVMPNETT